MSTWRRCSSCKKPIEHGATYWVCSVSTCNRARTPFQFCSVRCWDAHVPVMNHRSAWCEEKRAPKQDAAAGLPRASGTAGSPGRRASPSDPKAEQLRRRLARVSAKDEKKEVLIVASRLKAYIKARSDMNTSADVLDALSDIVRSESDRAIRRARAAGRKTVKGRDFRDD